MKTTSLMVLASVLLILLLSTTAHGIRLDRQLHEALNSKQKLAGDSKAGQPSDAVAHSTSSRCTSDGNCSGNARKPLAPHAAAAAAAPGAAKHQVQTPPKRINGDADVQSRGEAELTTASHTGGTGKLPRRLPPPQPEQARTTYPDILDIAGMDYSPASRKPPIHN